MISLIKLLLTRWLALRALIAGAGALLVALPVALALLKWVGLPLLAILGVVGMPLLLVLLVLGFPIFVVLIVGGGVMALVAVALVMGLVALKIALFVVLPLWVIWQLGAWMVRTMRGKGRGKGGGGADTQPAT